MAASGVSFPEDDGADTRYAMIEKEALGVTWACEKFDYFVVGRKFEVETDHKPLIALLGEKDLTHLPVRVQRFKMRLMRYDFIIKHTPGSQMYIANMLSRPNMGSEPSDNDLMQCRAIAKIAQVAADTCITDSFHDSRLRDALTGDPVVREVIGYIQTGWPETSRELRGEPLKMYPKRDSLTISGVIVWFEKRVYIPGSLRQSYLSRCHEGHQGIVKCKRAAPQHFWRPGLSRDIEDLVARCHVCIKNISIKRQPMEINALPERPWVDVGSDLFEWRNQTYLLAVDHYSKWIELEELPSQTSFGEIFAWFGIPEVLKVG